MKAVILAGGLGTRLKPFTDILPKPLMPISGEKSILEIQISHLKENGFNDIYIATNYKSTMIESYLGDGSNYGVNLYFSKEEKRLGTCGPLTLLQDKLDEPFLMMNGDILTELDFKALYDFSINDSSPLTVVTKEIITPFDFGNVILDGNKITAIEEKPDLKFIIVAGIYMMKPEIFKYIPKDEYFGMDTLINTLLKEKMPISSYFTNKYWVDIGRMDDLNQVRKHYETKET